MPKELDKKTEGFILEAIQDVCKNVEAGASPTDALAKTAEHMKLSKDFIRLISHGYNTGATTHQRESSTKILEKLADFPLCDGDAVISKLFPDKVEAPAEVKTSSAISGDYFRAPKLVEQKIRSEMHKAASEKLPYTEKPATYAGDKDIAMRKVINSYYDAKLTIERARTKAAAAQERFLKVLGDTSDTVRFNNPWPHGELRYIVESRFGKMGSSLMDYFHARNYVKEKRAACMPSLRRPINWSAEPLPSIVKCVKAAEESAEMKREYCDLKSKVESEVANTFRPFARTVVKKAEGGSKFILPTLIATGVNKAISPHGGYAQPDSDKVNELTADLVNPVHENELRRINAETMLRDLTTNDEVISGYEPHEVMNAWNEVVSAVPDASTKPALMRPLLRKRLTTGGLEPFEAEEMVRIQNLVGKNRQAPTLSVLARKTMKPSMESILAADEE